VVADSPEGVREAAASGAETIFFEPDLRLPARSCGRRAAPASPRKLLRQALEICRPAGIPLYWKLPRIVPDRFLDHAREALPALVADGLAGIMADDRGTAMALAACEGDLRVAAFFGLNIFNHAAASDAAALFSLIVLSPELSRDEIAALMTCLRSRGAMPATAVVIAGTCEAMVSEDCLRVLAVPCANVPGNDPGCLGIRDDTGGVWPVWTDHACRTTIGSAAELCLLPYLPSLRSAGIGEVILDARHHPPQYVREMTALCRQAVNWLHAHPGATDADPALAAISDKVRRITSGRTTPGHLLRGLRE
jgi:collagenase-like PrtC family protease